jgi:ankyrin repeat protein
MNDEFILAVVIGGHKKNVKYYLKRGANVNIQDRRGWTPLMYAIMCRQQKIVALLLKESNIDIGIKNNDGENALHIASRFSSSKILKKILETGIDADTKNNEGKNATLIAMYCGSVSCLKILLLKTGSCDSIIVKNYKVNNLLYKVIILVPMLSKRFRRINNDILRESIFYF